jgi:2-oxoisovalerate dehydrogenase E2 component (dihydrolipoyl transacylase)
MPQLGESVQEGTISRWLVKPGDAITEFAPMLEVETDKVSAELPAPVTGVLRQILAQQGETVRVGAEIAVVEVQSEVPDVRELSPEPVDRPEHRSEAGGPARQASATPAHQDQYGTGQRDPAPARHAGIPASQPAEGDRSVPLTRVRKRIAENMARSKATIPHAWQAQEVDMSGVVANRAANKDRFLAQEGYSLTYLPYVIKATATALREHPEVNSTFNESELILHGDINIGVSVGLEDTLVVPVIRRADQLSVAGIARVVTDKVQRAREGRLRVDDLYGGTFTVNNTGTFGTLLSYSVIIPGQSGILTMEAIVERPVAVGGSIGIKPMMYLCFSLDHRVLDGLAAARFLTGCRSWLEAVSEKTAIW